MKDSLNAMSILEKVYSQTQNQELREKELTEYINKLKERGQSGIIDQLSAMHINEGASENFSAFASTFKLEPAADTLGQSEFVDTLSTIDSNLGVEYKTSGDKNLDAQLNLSSYGETLQSQLAKEVEVYNQLQLENREFYETQDEANEKLDALVEQRNILANLEYDTVGPSRGRNYGFFGRPAAMRQVMQNNPELMEEISLAKQNKMQADRDAQYINPVNIYEGEDRTPQIKFDAIRGERVNNQINKIDAIINSLNYLEVEGDKTTLRTVPRTNAFGNVVGYTYPEQIILPEN